MKEWYVIDNVAELDSPQIVLYLDRVKHNIAEAIRMVGDVNRLRPHIKTNKTAEVVRLMLDAGIHKFKCATIEEAELLAREKAGDVLLAYQPVGPKIARLAGLIEKYPATRFSCLTDHPDAANAISDHFLAVGKPIDVYIDLNVGMNRTGISAGSFDLYTLCCTLPGIRVKGVHAYDGHLRDPDINVRKHQVDEAFTIVESLVKRIVNAGLDEPVIIVGGSPSFAVHSQRKGVECSPGTFVFWDKGYGDICPEQHFLQAALVISRVISIPSEGKLCLDMGHKSIAAENDISRRAYFVNEPLMKLVSQSEEHGLAGSYVKHVPGDLMYVMPYHICPTVNLYDKLIVVSDHKVTDTWRVAAKH